jgi:crotonobetainyl-CoA:carnitine CoA-transferase CaiB-like acyl-CoA transferase
LLEGVQVVAVGRSSDSALARYLATLGAKVSEVALEDLASSVPTASLLIEHMGLPALEKAGWPRSRIEALAPALIHVSVSTFGSFGPRASWKGGELVASAMSGVLRLTGQPDRAPVKEALDACGFHADMVAAAAALAAHYHRGESATGQHIDISIQEVGLSRQVNGVLVWQFDRRLLTRVGGALNYGLATVRCIWKLSDGWCFHSLMTGRFGAPANKALSDWIDESGLPNPLQGVDWLSYNRSTLDPALRVIWESGIEKFFLSRTKAEISQEGRRRGINATVAAEPREVLADPHLRAREFWKSQGPSAVVPSRFVTVHPAADKSPRASPRGSRPGPLSGVKVLDFSWALVGSITTKTLGDLGADVIKVESAARPCLSRMDVQVRASKAGNFDDKPWFAHLNTSKRSIALDMKNPGSAAVLEPLIQWADVVVENFSPGTMAKLGLDYAQLAKKNPGIVMVSGSVYGQTGPLAQEWGVDGTGGALSSRTFLTGWPDRDPVIPGAVPYGDVIVPYVMVAAVSAALQARRAGGRGAYIDASMYEICVQQMYDAILASQMQRSPARMGNRDARNFHQGVYPVTGEDRWIALELPSRTDWDRLRELAQLPDAADAAARDAAIENWTSAQSGPPLVELLQSSGFAAGDVQDIQDLLERDPQIAARGTLTPLEHAVLGEFGHLRTPATFSLSPPKIFRAPSLGEHSLAVAREIALLDAGSVSQLQKLGVFR